MNISLISNLSGDSYKKVRSLQKELSRVTGSISCLADWQPHITIGDGLVVDQQTMTGLTTELQAFAESHQPVKARIHGYAGIDNWKGAVEGKVTPYVIWLSVEMNDELMALWSSLRDKITARYEAWLPRTVEYNPHVTIAFSDLTKEGFEKGMAYLGENAHRIADIWFDINSITIAECYGEGYMQSVEHSRFLLAK